jgi:hypothetical protein
MKPAALLGLLFVTTLTFAQTQPSATPGRITAASVWQMPSTFLTDAHKACDNAAPASGFADCFINQMSKAGASPAAVAFTEALYKQSGGDIGILTGFHGSGPVNVGFVTYPLRANTNNGILFLNGMPKIVNAEDMKLLNLAQLKQDPQYGNTINQFPKATVWPGDRDGTTWPNSNPNSEGGTSFTLGYPMLNGCHACQKVGDVMFNWKFGPTGKFLGTAFMGMTPPPVQ